VPSLHLAVAPAGALGAWYGLQTVLPEELTYVPLGQFVAGRDVAGVVMAACVVSGCVVGGRVAGGRVTAGTVRGTVAVTTGYACRFAAVVVALATVVVATGVVVDAGFAEEAQPANARTATAAIQARLRHIVTSRTSTCLRRLPADPL
jgi:hypothetical protein